MPRTATTSSLPVTMKAVITTGNGGYDQLSYRDVPVPKLAPGEVLLQVLAAGVNNTDINTRLGWYSETVSTATAVVAEEQNEHVAAKADGGWNGATPFPFIQGVDCCGRVVAVASGEDESIIGTRVLVRSCVRPAGFGSLETNWLGCDFDGAFAQFLKVPSVEVFPLQSEWSDVELASMPCAYGTAENLLHRAQAARGEHVLIAGASGGVGSAAVQLAKRRGATVTAIAGQEKIEQVRSIGADRVISRGEDIVRALGENSVDLVIDNVAGPAFSAMLIVLKPGGRYGSSGAIGGPLVSLDMRNLYLKDLTLIGCTRWDEPVFPNLISYIEHDEIRPLVAATFALQQIADAQRAFLEKTYVGNLVLVPPIPE